MITRRIACAVAAAIALCACSSSPSTADAGGTIDAGPTDVGAADAGPTDAYRACVADCGTADDAGLRDAGVDAFVSMPPTYAAQTRTITSSAVARTFVLATPSDIASRGALPLVFSLHGDGGNGRGMRTALPLEAHGPATGAVYVYPDAPGGSFEYWSYDGRTREMQFVTDVIAALRSELGIDTRRVFITGFSGGATMANALGCRLGPSVIRGLGLHSGTLYATTGPAGPEFTYTASGGVSCPLPDALFVWGASDTTSGVSFTEGQGVRDNYVATASCGATTTSGPIAPCVTYVGCTHGVAWCPIPGMGHAIWSNAAQAMWSFFIALP